MKTPFRERLRPKIKILDWTKSSGDLLGTVDIGTLTVSPTGQVSVSLKDVADSEKFKEDLAILREVAEDLATLKEVASATPTK